MRAMCATVWIVVSSSDVTGEELCDAFIAIAETKHLQQYSHTCYSL